MINSQVLANSVATVMAVAYVLCFALAAVATNLLFAISNSWFHILTLDPANAGSTMTVGMFVLGLTSSVVVAWVFTYAVAQLYNRWAA